MNNLHARFKHYEVKLNAAGIIKPTKVDYENRYLFYKPMTALTAFIINFKLKDDCIEIVYGYASTAFTRFKGDENALIERGVDNDYINIREISIIRNEEDEIKAKEKIEEMYNQYSSIEKDELLNYAKLKRKAFIQQIAVKLKPLGFKKKENSWTRTLESEYYLMFNAQKSLYSDSYYFNIYIGKNGTNRYGDCYYTRVSPNEYPMDWQLINPREFDDFLVSVLVPELLKIINTPLIELGKGDYILKHCGCKRDICELCWVDNNL